MPNPRMKQRRVVHKSTAGILKPIPEAVDLVGNPPPGLTTKTVAPLHQRGSANRQSRSRFTERELRGAPRLLRRRSFLEAHPFGTVPAAFSPDGKVGIFNSNSIMRAVARLGESRFPLRGRDPYEASRVDSFLDASLVFARDSQIYLLALMSGTVSSEVHSRARDGFA